MGAGGDLRGRRARPPRRADAAPARPDVPDPLGRRGAPLRLRRRPGAAARRGGAVLRARRRAGRAVPRGPARGLRAGDPRGRAARLRRVRGLRPARARHGPARRAAAALLLRLAPLRGPAGARGVLLPLAVHRRRPVPRAGDLRRARLPAGPRRRLVRGRRDVQRRRGAGRAAGRALRRAGRADRARRRARDRRRAGGRRADRGRRGGLERRRPAHARAARAGRATAAAARDDVLLPALPRHGPRVRPPAPPHAARRRRLQGVHPRGHPRARAAADVLHLRPRARAHRAGDGAGGRRLAGDPPAGPEPAGGDRLGPRRRPAARRAGRRPRDELRPGRGSTRRSSPSTG